MFADHPVRKQAYLDLKIKILPGAFNCIFNFVSWLLLS